jgi:phenylpropionate dioxygenase-like ring-hydroxylating dioxygenase large terminal subunit
VKPGTVGTSDRVALDDWYAVAYHGEIPPGGREATRLLGYDLELARDAEGGFACAVARPDGTRAPRPVQVRHGFVWTTLGRPAHDILALPELDEGERRFIWRGRIGVPVSGQRVLENFFDLAHFSFVHTGTLGGYDSAEVPPYEVEHREGGRELWAVGCRFFQPRASASAGGGADVRYDYRIPSPFVCILYKDSLVRLGRKDLIGLFIQPREEEDCVVHSFALVHDAKNSDTDILHFYHEIFAQDRMILVQQRPRRLPVGPQAERSVASDSSAIAYRRWLYASGLQFGLVRDEVRGDPTPARAA